MKTKLVLFMLKNKKVLILTILYIIFFSCFYLIEPIRKNIFKEASQTLSNNYLFFLIIANLLIIFFIYFYFFKKNIIKTISFKHLFIASIIINLSLWLIWPIGSSDLFTYIYLGRIFSIFKESPYVAIYNNFSSDIFFDYLKNCWSGHITPYGPVFTIINSFFSFIFKNNIIANLFGLKLFFILINILNGYLVYKITKNKLSFFLYTFNPLILFEFAINGHNDCLMIFFILLSFFVINKKNLKNKNSIKNYLISFFILTLSFLTKIISIVFLPIFSLIILLKTKSTKNKIKIILSFIIIFFITTYFLYYPFINNPKNIINPLLNHSKILTIFMSPLILPLLLLIKSFFIKSVNVFDILLLGKILFLFFYLFIIFVIIKKSKNIDQNNYNDLLYWGSGVGLLFFYISSLSWVPPWYFIVLITMFILALDNKDKKQQYLLIILITTFYGILNYLVLR